MEKVLASKGLFCTGCGACASVCPSSAIHMEFDGEGFIKARIDGEACVGCGRCERTCPVISPRYANGTPECRAMQATDDERMPSSSGGIFPLLAKQVLAEGGVVFGALWNDDFSVSIAGVEDEEGLDAMRGSKYVQSSTADTFNEARQALKDGRRVLYSGTPCQIAGLDASLGDLSTDANLLTVEIVCHGAPSTTVLQDYLDEEFGRENVAGVTFRDKEAFGWSAGEKVTLKDGTEVSRKVSPYTSAFHPLLSVGRACGVCPFSRLPRQADISLGDFWGIELYDPSLNDMRGISVVLVNSDRGRAAIDAMDKDKIAVDEEAPLGYATEVNKTILEPFENNPGRKHFFLSRNMMPLEKLADVAMTHHYDVGVVGLWYGINYGSVLTYYALYELLRSLGKDPVMLPKPNGMWDDRFCDPSTIAQRFVNERCNVFQPYPSLGEYPFANDNCDAFIVGSDVVWSYKVCGSEVSQFFFLDWAKCDHRKVAYAASIGDGLGTDRKYVAEAKCNLRLFDAVSARETECADELADLTGRDDVATVMDPVFLCGTKLFSPIADEATGRQAPDGSVFAYILQGEMAPQKRRWAGLVADRLGTGKVIIGNASDAVAAHAIAGEEVITDMPVEDWIASVRGSRFYFGDSYHGLCFALMYHVPFLIVYPDSTPAKTRMTSLLGMLGLTNRMIESEDATDADVLAIVDADIDWERVDRILGHEVERSRAWLARALEGDGLQEVDGADRVHDEMIDRACMNALEARTERDRLRDRIGELEGRLAVANDRIAAAEERDARHLEELSAINASKSYRLGRMLTWVPRHARGFVSAHKVEVPSAPDAAEPVVEQC